MMHAQRSRSRKSVRQLMSTAVIAGGLGAVLAGCELTSSELETIDGAFELGDRQVAAPPVAPSCFNERFVQPEGEITRKIDLLFVTDTSGSLDYERRAIADGIDAFVGALPAEVDYRIGVMGAHGSRSAHSGRLYKHGPDPHVLDSMQMGLSEIRSKLRTKLMGVPSDRHSDGGEMGLYAITRAMDHGPMTSSRAKGFFREDAALAVVFIADENDICASFPEGVTPVPDPEGGEASARARDCTRRAPAWFEDGVQVSGAYDETITPESVLVKLRKLQGWKDGKAGRPLLVAGIVYNRAETVPADGENELGYGYLDLIRLANGVSVDLAEGHYNEGLSTIGSLATVKLNAVTEFTLARPEIDPATIQVQVDGQAVEFTYLPEPNEVQLSYAGGSRSVVDINYCLTSAQAPEEPEEPTDPGTDPGTDPETDPETDPGTGEDPNCTGLDCGVLGV